MAVGKRFCCGACGETIEAWGDGNPYYIDESGEKQYAYHPDNVRMAWRVGNDAPHICLECGGEFLVDSRAPTTLCPRCQSPAIAETFILEGQACPSCNRGVFTEDEFWHPIS